MDNLENSDIIVCSNCDKRKILLNNKKFSKTKIMSIYEFIQKVSFQYTTETIYYVMQKYNIKYEVALIYLESIIYCDINSENNKIVFLRNLKEELLEKNLIKYNDLFKEYIKDKKIIFYNINYDLKLINYLVKNLNVQFINDELKEETIKEIIHFNNLYDEVIYFGEEIINLLNNGVPASSIKIVGLPSEYKYPLKVIFNLLNLNIDPFTYTIYESEIGLYFLDNLDSDINKTLECLKKKYNNEIVNQIIDICNKYIWCDDFLKIKDMLIYELKNTKIKTNKLNNTLEIIDYLDMDIKSDDYFFLIGFNNENIPVIYKDNDYISDNICSYKETSNERYLREKKCLINKIKYVKNLVITYKDVSFFNTYTLSNLNDDLGYNCVTAKEKNISYSYILSHLKLTNLLERFEKYGEKDKKLELLYSSIDTDYKTYDNKFKGIDQALLDNYLNNKLLLSYTSIDNYYKCGFKFYINNILKIDAFETNFSAYIGSLMHYVLSQPKEINFDIDEKIKIYLHLHPYDFSEKEKYFLEKTKENLLFIIDELKNQKLLTAFDDELYEQKYFINKKKKYDVTIMGIIDKIMYLKKDGNTYLALIDYKTGTIETKLKYLDYGFQLQLPIYAYLVKNSDIVNPIISGLYYQKLLDNEIKEASEEEYLKEKKNNLKLQGLSTNDESILGLFDASYENSDLIKGMKKTSKGFAHYTKIFSENEMEDILNLVDQKIDAVIDNVVNGNFAINPKKIAKENVSCKFCKYKDICFKQENDVVIIEEGDDDAKLD